VGKGLAGKSTLNRLELTTADAGPASRYKKIVIDGAGVDRLFVNVFLHAFRKAPRQIVLDLDATDDPLHGNQEGRFFHGFYGHYCYLPLYIFCGEFLLCARLRRSNLDASAGTVEELQRLVAQIRAAWPRVRIIIRADSGFAREAIMAWCEAHAVDYVLGLAKNARLKRALSRELEQAEREHAHTGAPARVFKDFTYTTRKSWSRRRRVVGKAEHLPAGPNPRFVVTSLSKDDMDARALYEELYCARGDMENRIKEQQLGLFADRTSTATMRANQIRLWLSSVAYVLLHALRRLGLQGTALAKAQCSTIRLKLLKIGAQVRVTVRKIWVSLASGSPYAAIFEQTYHNLLAVPLHC
jgi:Transposase DDE domain group 1